jgi:hypothetical protein
MVKLIIANAKGFEVNLNGGATYKLGPDEVYIGSLMKGTVQAVAIPEDEQLQS